MDIYLGIDVGSVSTNLICIDEKGKVLKSLYLRTNGKPIATVQQGLREMAQQLPAAIKVRGVGATGSGRHLAGIIVGADIIKNEDVYKRQVQQFYRLLLQPDPTSFF